jgi:hypothetical protein
MMETKTNQNSKGSQGAIHEYSCWKGTWTSNKNLLKWSILLSDISHSFAKKKSSSDGQDKHLPTK